MRLRSLGPTEGKGASFSDWPLETAHNWAGQPSILNNPVSTNLEADDSGCWKAFSFGGFHVNGQVGPLFWWDILLLPLEVHPTKTNGGSVLASVSARTCASTGSGPS